MRPGERRDLALEGDRRYVVALSDVHLGTDTPTTWYQRHHHEPFLVHLLEWVLANADAISELVLLGDIVDLWTYPNDVVPPTFADIAACHPRILGPDGLLTEALDALGGAVTYVPGNHDMGITDADLAIVARPGSSHRISVVDELPHYPLRRTDGTVDTRLALAHGHHFTLFNAPDVDSPWAPLPLGYFVTRAVATSWARRLPPGTTVAELADQGAPNGLDLRSLRSMASGWAGASIAAALLDFVVTATGVTLDEPVLMPDGSTPTLREARDAYSSLWWSWAEDHGGGAIGKAAAMRATLADFDGSCLGWFAQRLAFGGRAAFARWDLDEDAPHTPGLLDTELVVMGHTHIPIGGLDGSPIQYLNTGFDCPSAPDLLRRRSPQHATFAVIDTRAPRADPDDPSMRARTWAVEGPRGAPATPPLACQPFDAPRTRVVHGRAMDFSCYVTVDNRSGSADLELASARATHGAWVVEPPARIGRGEVARFWVQDLLGAAGSGATVTYRPAGAAVAAADETIELRCSCPTIGNNHASGPGMRTRAGHGAWHDDGAVARRGHPLFASFRLS
jgi:UDP-2,3-diacylglucosamine pyrophosphatase LpxH